MEYAKLYDHVTERYRIIERNRRDCQIDWYLWSEETFDEDTAIVIVLGLETASGD